MKFHEMIAKLDATSGQVVAMLAMGLLFMAMYATVWVRGSRQRDDVRSAHGAGLVIGVFSMLFVIAVFAYVGS